MVTDVNGNPARHGGTIIAAATKSLHEQALRVQPLPPDHPLSAALATIDAGIKELAESLADSPKPIPTLERSSP